MKIVGTPEAIPVVYWTSRFLRVTNYLIDVVSQFKLLTASIPAWLGSCELVPPSIV